MFRRILLVLALSAVPAFAQEAPVWTVPEVGALPQDDYELHCLAIQECKVRTPLAERLQRELDERFAPALACAARCKDGAALAQWWQQRLQEGVGVPAAF